jgi:hypothetical protein
VAEAEAERETDVRKALILAAAVVLLHVVMSAPFAGEVYCPDESMMATRAMHMASGNLTWTHPSRGMGLPGYPIALMPAAWLSAGDPAWLWRWAQFENALLAGAVVLLAFMALRQRFGERAALCGAAAVALYSANVVMPALVLSENLALPLLWGAVWCAGRIASASTIDEVDAFWARWQWERKSLGINPLPRRPEQWCILLWWRVRLAICRSMEVFFRHPAWRWWLLLALISVVTCCTRLTSAPVMAGLAVIAGVSVVKLGRRRRSWGILGLLALVVATLAAWKWLPYRMGGAEFWDLVGLSRDCSPGFPFSGFAAALGMDLGYVVVGSLGLVVPFAVWLWRRPRGLDSLFVAAVAVGTLALVAAAMGVGFWQAGERLIGRYLDPLVTLALAFGAAVLVSERRYWLLVGGAAVALALALVARQWFGVGTALNNLGVTWVFESPWLLLPLGVAALVAIAPRFRWWAVLLVGVTLAVPAYGAAYEQAQTFRQYAEFAFDAGPELRAWSARHPARPARLYAMPVPPELHWARAAYGCEIERMNPGWILLDVPGDGFVPAGSLLLSRGDAPGRIVFARGPWTITEVTVP